METQQPLRTPALPAALYNDKTLREQLLVANLWVILFTIVASAVLIVPLGGDSAMALLSGLFPYAVTNILALILAYRGRVMLALAEYSAMCFLMYSASIFLLRELPPHMLLAMVNFIILNGVVLGARAALFTTVWTVVISIAGPKLGLQYEAWTFHLADLYSIDLKLSERTLSMSLVTTTFSTAFLITTTLRLHDATRARLKRTLRELQVAQEDLELRRVRAEELADLGSRLSGSTTREEVEQGVHSSITAVIPDHQRTWSEAPPSGPERFLRFGSFSESRWLILEEVAPSDATAFLLTVAELRDAAFARINSVERLSNAARQEGVGRLAASVAHDFNNLLVPITAAQDILDIESAISDRSRQVLLRSRAASVQAAALIAKLLTHARARHGEVQIINASRIFDEIEPLLKTFLPSGVNLECLRPAGEVYVQMDPIELEQIVLNLVLNARDAIGSQGNIRMMLTTHTDYAVMVVEDDGPGIPEDIRQWVLEPFHTTREEGTGLGLATVNRIVLQSRGLLTIDRSPQGGAQIRIQLPIDVQPRHSSPSEKVVEPAEKRACLQILLVDDDESVAETTSELLRTLGHHVQVVASAQSALSRLRPPHPFDIVLSDFQMADCTGMQLLQQLRDAEDQTPFVIVSGYGAAISSSAEHQPEEIISKPVFLRDFQRLLQKHTRNERA